MKGRGKKTTRGCPHQLIIERLCPYDAVGEKKNTRGRKGNITLQFEPLTATEEKGT